MNVPKFHDRKSLVIGVIAGLFINAIGWTLVDDGRWLVGLIQVGVGVGLSVHCIDMIKYYKKHRIVKIEKTPTYRIITKE